MNTRLAIIKRLAESDPYWRGYLDGMAERHAIRRTESTDGAWREYARLTQARLDRNADPTDYDSEWKRNTVALNPHTEEYRRLARVLADVTDVDAIVNRVLDD